MTLDIEKLRRLSATVAELKSAVGATGTPSVDATGWGIRMQMDCNRKLSADLRAIARLGGEERAQAVKLMDFILKSAERNPKRTT